MWPTVWPGVSTIWRPNTCVAVGSAVSGRGTVTRGEVGRPDVPGRLRRAPSRTAVDAARVVRMLVGQDHMADRGQSSPSRSARRRSRPRCRRRRCRRSRPRRRGPARRPRRTEVDPLPGERPSGYAAGGRAAGGGREREDGAAGDTGRCGVDAARRLIAAWRRGDPAPGARLGAHRTSETIAKATRLNRDRRGTCGASLARAASAQCTTVASRANPGSAGAPRAVETPECACQARNVRRRGGQVASGGQIRRSAGRTAPVAHVRQCWAPPGRRQRR